MERALTATRIVLLLLASEHVLSARFSELGIACMDSRLTDSS